MTFRLEEIEMIIVENAIRLGSGFYCHFWDVLLVLSPQDRFSNFQSRKLFPNSSFGDMFFFCFTLRNEKQNMLQNIQVKQIFRKILEFNKYWILTVILYVM